MKNVYTVIANLLSVTFDGSITAQYDNGASQWTIAVPTTEMGLELARFLANDTWVPVELELESQEAYGHSLPSLLRAWAPAPDQTPGDWPKGCSYCNGSHVGIECPV